MASYLTVGISLALIFLCPLAGQRVSLDGARVSQGSASTPTRLDPRIFRVSGAVGIRDAASLEPAVMTRTGGLIVARRELAAVDVFDPAGRLLARLPRRGEGISAIPRVSLALVGGDTLIILDGRSRKLGFYTVGPNRTPRLQRTVQLVRSYVDMCAMNNHLVLANPGSGGSVDNLDLRSNELRHDWVFTEPPRPVLEEALNESRIVCNPNGNQFAVANVLSGILRAYDQTGRLLWTKHVRGHVSPLATRDTGPSGRSFALSAPTGGYHTLARALFVDSASILLQYASVGAKRRSWGQLGPVLSVVLRTSDGSEIGRSNTVPVVIAARNSRLIAFESSAGLLIEQPSQLPLRAMNAR